MIGCCDSRQKSRHAAADNGDFLPVELIKLFYLRSSQTAVLPAIHIQRKETVPDTLQFKTG